MQRGKDARERRNKSQRKSKKLKCWLLRVGSRMIGERKRSGRASSMKECENIVVWIAIRERNGQTCIETVSLLTETSDKG